MKNRDFIFHYVDVEELPAVPTTSPRTAVNPDSQFNGVNGNRFLLTNRLLLPALIFALCSSPTSLRTYECVCCCSPIEYTVYELVHECL